MPASYRFNQACPTCGRMLSVSIQLLGRRIACQHCQAEFTAIHRPPPTSPPLAESPLTDSALAQRVDELLRQADAVVEGTL